MVAAVISYNECVFFAQALTALLVVLIAARFGPVALTVVVATFAVIMNIIVMKQMNLFGLAVTGGNVMYAAIFLTTDVLEEHFGPQPARRAVWAGFAASAITVLMTQFVLLYEPNQFDDAQEHLLYFFSGSQYPRVVAASMVSFLLSQHLDVWLFGKLRELTRGRFLWLRNNGSTLISQLVDSVFFTVAGLYGNVITDVSTLVSVICFTYAVKVIMALLDTPFIYLSKTKWFCPARGAAQ